MVDKEKIEAVIREIKEKTNVDSAQWESVRALMKGIESLGISDFYVRAILGELVDGSLKGVAYDLGIEEKSPRALYMIQVPKKDTKVLMAVIQNLYSDRDWVFSMEEGLLLLVKHMEEAEGEEALKEIAHTLVDTIQGELMVPVVLSYGSIFAHIGEITKAHMESSVALEVGQSFYPEKRVLSYGDLGMGRLIHGISPELGKCYLEDVLKGHSLESFDEETMGVVYKFYQNNLNISETARQLYLHRNTLVYRLEKIQKKTDLDIRYFEDAMTFKTALLIWSHMKYKHNKK